MPAPTLSQIQAATLAWAQAHPNKPGVDTDPSEPADSASAIATNTPVWNQVFDSLDDLNNLILATTAYAKGTLTFTPGAIADDKVVMDGVYYQFAADPTSDALADGTSGHPWQVAVGADDEGSLANLYAAINASGVAGTNYSPDLTAHPTMEATSKAATTVDVQAKSNGTGGNSLATTVTAVSSADGLAWGGATLSGGAGASADAQDAVDDWRDSLRAVPLSLNADAEAEVDAAIAALKTSVGALYS